MNPLISIVVPIYKAEKYLAECIESVINQKYTNFELILVDDGSPDNCPQICDEYAKKDKRIKVLHKKNGGISSARNAGLEVANGEYVSFLDSDDYLKETWSHAVSAISDNEDVVYIYKNVNIENKKDLYHHVMRLKSPCFAGPYCKFFKKEFLSNNNIKFKEGLANSEDMLFNLECIRHLKIFRVVDESTYMYRQNPTSLTKTYNPKLIDAERTFHECFDEIIKEQMSLEDVKELKDFAGLQTVLMVAERAGHIRSFKEYKATIKRLDEKPYPDFIKAPKKYITKKQKLVFFLLEHKLYFSLFIITKLYHKWLARNKKGEWFIEL